MIEPRLAGAKAKRRICELALQEVAGKLRPEGSKDVSTECKHDQYYTHDSNRLATKLIQELW